MDVFHSSILNIMYTYLLVIAFHIVSYWMFNDQLSRITFNKYQPILPPSGGIWIFFFFSKLTFNRVTSRNFTALNPRLAEMINLTTENLVDFLIAGDQGGFRPPRRGFVLSIEMNLITLGFFLKLPWLFASTCVPHRPGLSYRAQTAFLAIEPQLVLTLPSYL